MRANLRLWALLGLATKLRAKTGGKNWSMSVVHSVKLCVFGMIAFLLVACSDDAEPNEERRAVVEEPPRSTIWDLFENRDDPNVTVAVNRYIWNATLDVLSFLPVESADPFSGVIVFDFGTPPGGNQAYRGTALINDPALDARSLNLSLQSRSGPVDADTQRAVEDAILTRARQLRLADRRL